MRKPSNLVLHIAKTYDMQTLWEALAIQYTENVCAITLAMRADGDECENPSVQGVVEMLQDGMHDDGLPEMVSAVRDFAPAILRAFNG